MSTTPASNKYGNFVAWLALCGLVYLGFTFGPPFVDNYQLKQVARMYAASARWPEYEEKAREHFKREATALLGQPFDDDNFVFERLGKDEARVTVFYNKDAWYPFTAKRKTLKYHWVVVTRFTESW